MLTLPHVEASLLSNALKNTSKTVHKAVADTGAEINRAKEKVTGSAANVDATKVATREIDRLGEELKTARTDKIEAQDEKDVAYFGFSGLAGTVLGGVIAMASTGMFGRHERREKYLAAVLRELELDREGFDFSRLTHYRRLCDPTKSVK